MATTGEQIQILDALKQLVAPLNRTLSDPSEVVLHDLSLLPNSVVAVAGELSDQQPGGRAHDSLIRLVNERRFEARIGFRAQLEDLEVRSSVYFIRDSQGEPFAALVISFDVSLWHSVRAVAEAMLAAREMRFTGTDETHPVPEVPTISELGERLLEQAIATAGVPVALMQKKHKVAVVADLRAKGFFALREAVELLAAALDVSRFTIYNYINEIEEEHP